jgi:3-oxoacyl-[acyl-carrier-protein] synthase III
MTPSIIRATALALPHTVVTNDEIAEMLVRGSAADTPVAEHDRTRERGRDIERKTGLVERRFFAPDANPVDGAYDVLGQLIEEAALPWGELDAIIVSSSSIHGFPGVSQQLVARARADHPELGHPYVLDIGSNACTSFMYALGTASALLDSLGYRSVACIAVEFASRCLAYNTKAFGISTLFGDAVAGVLLGREGPGAATIESVRLASRIDADAISQIHGSGMQASDLTAAVPESARWYMSGPAVAIGAIDILVTEIARYQQAGTNVDWLIPHQANLTRILLPACDKLGIPRARLCASFERTGNTSSASIPLLLHELLTSGKAQRGENVVMVGFGASFSTGSAHLRIL